ncbi:hypothetical protein PHYSODRAFT_504326, partial [Phytophthora sojae]
DEQHKRSHHAATYLPRLAAKAAQNLRSATYQPRFHERIRVQVDLASIRPNVPAPKDIQAFWGTFAWADNPWIPDSNAPSLQRSKYDRIKVTSIANLSIVRASEDVYEVRVPTADGFPAGHTIAKLERWLIAILLSSPRLDIGQQLGRPPALVLRRPPSLSTSYTWSVEVEGSTVRGISNNGSATLMLEQKPRH